MGRIGQERGNAPADFARVLAIERFLERFFQGIVAGEGIGHIRPGHRSEYENVTVEGAEHPEAAEQDKGPLGEGWMFHEHEKSKSPPKIDQAIALVRPSHFRGVFGALSKSKYAALPRAPR